MSTSVSSSIATLRSRLAQLGYSTAELTKMSIESELTIRAHCDAIRNKVDIARETALENIHKASKALMTEIDTYERECLSSWAKARAEHVVEDVSKRMRAFIAEKQTFLQSVLESDDTLPLCLDEAKKLAQELSDRKKQLKAAMFNDKLASFIAFSSIDDTSLGEMAFTAIKTPFKTLGNTALKLIVISAAYDFVVPLGNGQRIVTFKGDDLKDQTQISCFDRLGRLIGSDNLKYTVERENVVPCAPNQFVVCHESDSFKLSVYNSSLHRLRSVDCKMFSNICCNSKFVFGLSDTCDSYETDSDDDDDDEQEDETYSSHRIQVHHLDTLSEAFELRVPNKYTMERIMADEHRVVAMSRRSNKPSRHWYMTIFDLATCILSDNRQQAKRARTKKAAAGEFFLAEKHVRLDLGPGFVLDTEYFSQMFLFDGWLVVPRDNRELVWFDKNGTPSRTSTERDTNFKDLYASGSILLLTTHDDKLLLKR